MVMNKVFKSGQWFRKSKKTGKISKIPLSRCSNTKTESEFRSWILGGLRKLTMMWKPSSDAWKIDKRQNLSGGKHRFEHKCNFCNHWYPRKTRKNGFGIELDHVIPIGGLSDISKAGEWINKAFVEIEGYQKLCTTCHLKKTLLELRR